ncbi:Negative regulator of sexual conjugation and meiosis [Grifola frondosa]|uniref:non-specific serine/threonine protein kinase n=1 Tax=Grifola frondosa TaxID=5627 RepID=A0A1C7MMG1_GRIFR|nr:Negative regulator of sexual conjugation and meiosis [Grifola frondosa]
MVARLKAIGCITVAFIHVDNAYGPSSSDETDGSKAERHKSPLPEPIIVLTLIFTFNMPTRKHLPNLSLKFIDSGRIQLLEILGAGAFGTIYLARDYKYSSTDPKICAVKVLPVSAPNSRRALYQSREIELHQAASSHPNVLTVHRDFRDERYLYIVLDYCPAGDLFQVVVRKRTLARNDALIKRLFLQLIDAVDSCHTKGIFHRDLKPENILVNEDLTELYVSDFGLATPTRKSVSHNAGSSLYMSPECFLTNSATPAVPYDTRRSDIWALGVILTTMVTGRTPWGRATLDDNCFRSFAKNRNFLLRMLPISPGMNTILKRIFTFNPSDTIKLHELRQLVEGLDTFYMSDEERARANDHVIAAWNFYLPPSTADPTHFGSDESLSDTDSESNSLDDDSDDSDEESAGFESDVLPHKEEGEADCYPAVNSPLDDSSESDIQPAFQLRVMNPTYTKPDLGSRVMAQAPSSSASSSSDSDEAVTPETHAQDPVIVIPDSLEGGTLGEPALSPGGMAGKKRHSGARLLKRLVRSFVG